MEQIINYISPEVELLTFTEMGVLCTSNQFTTEQNESIIENEFTW